MVVDINRIPIYQRQLDLALSGMLDSIGEEALKRIDESFEREQTPEGAPWAPLAPATIERKGHDTILYDTGDLRDSFDMEVSRNPTGVKQVMVYTEDEKMKYHEYGTETIPRRPVIGPLARYLHSEVIADELQEAALHAEATSGVSGNYY